MHLSVLKPPNAILTTVYFWSMIVKRIYAKSPECIYAKAPNAMLLTVYFLGQYSGSSRHLHLGVDTSSSLNYDELAWRRKTHLLLWILTHCWPADEKQLNFSLILTHLHGEEKHIFSLNFRPEKKNNSTSLNFVVLACRSIVSTENDPWLRKTIVAFLLNMNQDQLNQWANHQTQKKVTKPLKEMVAQWFFPCAVMAILAPRVIQSSRDQDLPAAMVRPIYGG